MAEEWVVIFTAANQVEAELIRGLLEGSQIPVIIEARGPQAMPFFFGQTALGGELLVKVPPDQADFARELLAAQVEEDASESEQ